MEDKIELVESDFTLVPEGENVPLTIKSVSAKPKAKPTVIEVVFEHENGATIKNKYDLIKKRPGDKSPLGLFLFSVLVKKVLGNETKVISISKDSPRLVGATLSCEVVHNESSQGNTFANIKRVNSLIKDVEEAETLELGIDEDDL